MKIALNKPFLPPYKEYADKIKSCWDSYHLSNTGPIEKEFARELGSWGLRQPRLVVNGHAALELSLDALDLSGEVITTPFTFISTTNAIFRRNLKPVFADIDEKTFNIRPSSVESLINENTVAILAVHVFGVPCDVKQLQVIADKYGIKLIYDAAHAFGVSIDSTDISHFGDVSVFSFHATKLFHSIEGGVVCCDDEVLSRNIATLRNFGIKNEGRVDDCGMNAKMHEFSAAMGVVNLSYIEEIIGKRKKIFQRYQKNLEGIDGLCLQNRQAADSSTDNYAYFAVRVLPGSGLSSGHVLQALKEKEIEARKYFYPLTSEAGYLDKACVELPVAISVSGSVLTLPLHYHLSYDDVDYVCEAITDIFYAGSVSA